MASPTVIVPTLIVPTLIVKAPESRRRALPSNSPGVRSRASSRTATRTPGVSPRTGRLATSRASGSSSLRLTARGRVAAFLGSVTILIGIVVSAGQIADASNQSGVQDPTTVVVQAGETLWGIARETAPGHDPRMVVSQIRELNDLGTRSIVPGQTLVVPTLG